MPAVIRACLAGMVPKCSHSRQIRDFLHVRDVAAAFVALLKSQVTGAVNIGSGNPIALRDVVGKIAELCGGNEADFGAFSTAPNDPPLLVPRVNRLHDEVGWSPAITLETGLKDAISFWKSASEIAI